MSLACPVYFHSLSLSSHSFPRTPSLLIAVRFVKNSDEYSLTANIHPHSWKIQIKYVHWRFRGIHLSSRLYEFHFTINIAFDHFVNFQMKSPLAMKHKAGLREKREIQSYTMTQEWDQNGKFQKMKKGKENLINLYSVTDFYFKC